MPDRSECHIFSTSPVDSLAVCLCSSGKKPFARTCCDDSIFLKSILRIQRIVGFKSLVPTPHQLLPFLALISACGQSIA